MALRLERQAEFVELLLGLFGGFEVFLRGVEGLVAEPGLDGAYVNSCAEPAGCGGAPEAVEVPLLGLESRAPSDG